MQQRIYPTISITAQESDITNPIPGQLYYFQDTKKLAIGVTGEEKKLTEVGVSDITVNGTSIVQDGVAELDYAIRSVQPNITSIDTSVTEYNLLDASATTNDHSCTYAHTPEASCTYTLPNVTNPDVEHRIILYVKHTTTSIKATFKDSNGTAITPIGGNYTNPVANEVVEYDCLWVDALSRWVIHVKRISNPPYLPTHADTAAGCSGTYTFSGITILANGYGLIINGNDNNVPRNYTGLRGISFGHNQTCSLVNNEIYGFGQALDLYSGDTLFCGKYNYNGYGNVGKRFVVGGGSGNSLRYEALSVTDNGGIRQGVTVIPSNSASAQLVEGMQTHVPDTSPVYTLPEVRMIMSLTSDAAPFTRFADGDGTGYFAWKNANRIRYTASASPAIGDKYFTNTTLTQGSKTITHNAPVTTYTIFLEVDMANTASVVFQDSDGNPITPSLAGDTPTVGDVWQFMCEYSSVQNKWLILGYKEY